MNECTKCPSFTCSATSAKPGQTTPGLRYGTLKRTLKRTLDFAPPLPLASRSVEEINKQAPIRSFFPFYTPFQTTPTHPSLCQHCTSPQPSSHSIQSLISSSNMSDNQSSTLKSYVDSATGTVQSALGSLTGNTGDQVSTSAFE